MAEEQEQGESQAVEGKEKKSGATGCGLISLLLGVAALGWGVHLMNRWDALAGPTKAGAILLVVLGALLALPMILLVVLKLVLRIFFGKVAKALAEAGEQIVGQNKAMYGSIHEFRPAEEDDFDSVDRGYYDTVLKHFTDAGYRHLGDLVDITLQEMGQACPPIRVMASGDGSVTLGLYHYVPDPMPPQLEGKQLLICDVTTEFSDGTFLMTSNTQGLDMMTPPPQIERRHHPLETPVVELVQFHEAEKQSLLQEKPQVSCVRIETLEDAIESEKRQQAVKNAFRKQIGYADPEEVRDIAEKANMEEGLADMAAGAVDEARKKEAGQGNGNGV